MWRQNFLLSEWLVLAVLIAALLSQFTLALVNAHLFSTSATIVSAYDGLIVCAAIGLAFLAKRKLTAIIVTAILFNAYLLFLFGGEFDPKSIRDVLVISAFLILGMGHPNPDLSRVAFIASAILVVSVGLFEWIATDAYSSIVNPQSFYVSRGALAAESTYWMQEGLRGNSFRLTDRNFLPFLGQQRIGSVFLEPIAMGNYGVIAVIWGLTRPAYEKWTRFFALAVGAFCVIACDGRFGVSIAIVMALLMLYPREVVRLTLWVLPFAAIVLLVYHASGYEPPWRDDLIGRLAASGAHIANLTLSEAFGLTRLHTGVDAGFYYAITAFGILFSLALWIGYCELPTHTIEANRYKLLMGVYVIAILCVSGSSLFALKQASLAWFLFGAAIAPIRGSLDLPPPRQTRSVSATHSEQPI